MSRVTLISDFGTADGYAGVMKGVMVSMAPDLFLDDITHDISPGDVEKASQVVGRVWSRFPPGTIHLVVVDPGVGTERRGIALGAGGHFFVAPDNGVLSRVLRADPGWRGVVLASSPPLPSPSSTTFHGRDLFAPAVALLASGIPMDALGPELQDPEMLPSYRSGEAAGEGRVMEVDRFGNLALDLPVELVVESGGVEVDGILIPLLATYAEGEKDGLLALVNSDGLVEIAVRDGSAAERLGIGVGAVVQVRDSTHR